ncbi:MAG: phosphatase PAP2 family protein [Spirochaetota bacterium]
MKYSLSRYALRHHVDLTFYAVNLFLAAVNIVLAFTAGDLFAGGSMGEIATRAAGSEPVGREGGTAPGFSAARHLLVAFLFIAACGVPSALSLLSDVAVSKARRGLPGRIAAFFRTFYVHAFYGPYFTEIIVLSQAVWQGASLDALVAKLEAVVFGFQPAVAFSGALSHLPVVNELFFFGYFSYYLIITTGFWVMFFRGFDHEARRAVFIATTSFAMLYVWYVFVPVHGPKYFIEALNRAWYSEFDGYLFVPMMKGVFANMNLGGAALPSSHVAIGLMATLLIRKHLPRLFWVYLALFLLLCASTIYVYAHYAVDLIAGLLVVPPLFWVSQRIYARVAELRPLQSARGSSGARRR